MNRTRKIFPIMFLLMVLTSACSDANNPKVETVKNLELERYMGKWYEIARFPHAFEKDLVGVTATYKLREDGKIDVVNAGYKHTLDGKYKSAKGKAKIPNPEEPGKLKVSFFLFFYADYNVLELDTVNYNYALIGSSTSDYLWILGRSPKMSDSIYNMLVDKAVDLGYDTSKLYRVPQPE